MSVGSPADAENSNSNTGPEPASITEPLNENPNNLPAPLFCSATLNCQSPGTRSVPTAPSITKLSGASTKSI